MSRVSESIKWLEEFYDGLKELPKKEDVSYTFFTEFMGSYPELIPIINEGKITMDDIIYDMGIEPYEFEDETYKHLVCNVSISKKLYNYIEELIPEALI